MEIWRELAAAYPDRYRPDLAASLSNLGVRFSALGRPAEALPAEQEAVAIRRELAAAYPDRYRPDLAALAVQPRRPVLGAGPPGRGAAADPGGGGDLPGAGRRLPRPVPARPGRARCPTSASGSRSWAARPRRCRLNRRRWRSGGSWPPPTPTGTGPTWPARCPTSASVLGAGPPGRGAAGDPGGGGDPAGAGRRLPRPVPARPGRLAVQPRRPVLGAGPPGRGAAGDPGGGGDPAGAGRRLPRPVPARPGRLAVQPRRPRSRRWAARPRRCR